MKCTECDFDYPPEILSPMHGVGTVCGICALAASNRIHRENRTQFDAPIAEEMRQAAVKAQADAAREME